MQTTINEVHSAAGTLDYMAPEILMLPVSAQGEEPVGQKEYDEQVDAWWVHLKQRYSGFCQTNDGKDSHAMLRSPSMSAFGSR